MSLKLGMAVAWTWIFLIVFLVTAPLGGHFCHLGGSNAGGCKMGKMVI